MPSIGLSPTITSFSFPPFNRHFRTSHTFSTLNDMQEKIEAEKGLTDDGEEWIREREREWYDDEYDDDERLSHNI